ncbi:Prolyl 3,4-dihydroxylase TPA1 [Smittium culicis]|uniref:Prolyl 3,4-dihydroxylase TPA1 n=1 Tax=Smittium culicis TaxID=133412 RepID=A0A1R1XLZ2_9FUNG|nr:Prolyl 3,4-dihydroxylase TPA1 [Smittium culicis]
MHPQKKQKIELELNKGSEISEKDRDFLATKWFANNLVENNEVLDKLKQEYNDSKPYNHCIIKNVINSELISRVKKEITTKLSFTRKQTDIYAYHQSGDLANLDGLNKDEINSLNNLKALRDAIYSNKFRDFVSKVTGCGPLSGSVTDMSANIYYNRDHLLLHDDVIGDRRISFILYIPETDSEASSWDPENGGGLELYPQLNDSSVPDNLPSCKLELEYNQMIFFAVEPGRSFHSVEEVISKSNKNRRISIQGWFHYPQRDEPGYIENAKMIRSGIPTLAQIFKGGDYAEFSTRFNEIPLSEDKNQETTLDLKNGEGEALNGNLAHEKILPASSNVLGTENIKSSNDDIKECESETSFDYTLTDSDIAHLSKYINEEYLSEKILDQISNLFLDQSFIQLGKFLKKELSEKIELMVDSLDSHDGFNKEKIPLHTAAISSDWKVCGPPVLRRFLKLEQTLASTDEINVPESELAGILREIQTSVFESVSFKKWLARITAIEPILAHRGAVRRFRPGLDYILASPSSEQTSTLDACLCLTPSANSAGKRDLWKSGDIGGFECYVTIDTDDSKASVYDRPAGHESDDALLTVPASWNTLNLVYCEQDVNKFVKYISASAGGSRFDFFNEYKV